MAKFKVGDKVRRISISHILSGLSDKDYPLLPIGYVGIVRGLNSISKTELIQVDDLYTMDERRFELVKEEPKMQIDKVGKYITKDGNKAVVLCIDAPGHYSVKGYIFSSVVKDETYMAEWSTDGLAWNNAGRSIVGPWVKKVKKEIKMRFVEWNNQIWACDTEINHTSNDKQLGWHTVTIEVEETE